MVLTSALVLLTGRKGLSWSMIMANIDYSCIMADIECCIAITIVLNSNHQQPLLGNNYIMSLLVTVIVCAG